MRGEKMKEGIKKIKILVIIILVIIRIFSIWYVNHRKKQIEKQILKEQNITEKQLQNNFLFRAEGI